MRYHERIRGAYALVICTGHSVIGVRDPFGYRPLVIGRTSRGDGPGIGDLRAGCSRGTAVRDVQPGEIVTVDAEGIHSIFCREAGGHRRAMCVFEYIYFARPDSIMNGQSIYQARLNMGRELWKETGYEADAVMSVPDSGNVAALGYSHASGIPYIEADEE